MAFAVLALSQCGQLLSAGGSVSQSGGPIGEREREAVYEGLTEPTFELAGLSSNAPAPTPELAALPAERPLPVLIGVERAYPFIWPATGPITSIMGPVHPLGIDVGLDNSVVSPIVATAAGTVSVAGGSDAEDYGLHVEVNHGSGLSTLYAHFSKILVSPGQKVRQGDVLGHGGSTGKSDGKHLHFEVRLAGAVVDPMRLLPAQGKLVERGSSECGPTPLVIDRGSRTTLNFDSAVGPQDVMMSGTLVSLAAGAPALDSLVVQRTAVELLSAPGFGAAKDDAYKLNVKFFDGVTERTFECDVLMKTRTVTPSYYVRVYPTSSATATVTTTATSTATTTPTAGPSGTGTATVATGTTTPTPAALGQADRPATATPTAGPPPNLDNPQQLEAADLQQLLPTVQASLFGTPTPVPAATNTATAVPATPTPAPATPTATAVPPTATPVPPTATPVPPTKTPVPPTPVPPTVAPQATVPPAPTVKP